MSASRQADATPLPIYTSGMFYFLEASPALGAYGPWRYNAVSRCRAYWKSRRRSALLAVSSWASSWRCASCARRSARCNNPLRCQRSAIPSPPTSSPPSYWVIRSGASCWISTPGQLCRRQSAASFYTVRAAVGRLPSGCSCATPQKTRWPRRAHSARSRAGLPLRRGSSAAGHLSANSPSIAPRSEPRRRRRSVTAPSSR